MTERGLKDDSQVSALCKWRDNRVIRGNIRRPAQGAKFINCSGYAEF